MTQEVEHLNPDEFWRTYDLGLCSALFCLEHELCEIEKGDNPNKAQFVFRRDKNLQKHIEDYWNDCLKLNVRSYFDAIRCVKNRLYSSWSSMQLTEEDIVEFQILYERNCGKHIEKAEAHTKAISLIRLMQIICCPLTDRENGIAETLSTL